jgi:hypothetical protein
VAALHRADGSTEDAVEPQADSDLVEATVTTRESQSVFRRFKAWRRRRPFWGAVFSILGGAEILYLQSAPMRVVVHFGLVGQLGFAVPILIILCGVLLLFAPNPRIFYASLVLVLGLASWITSNLGGFILGMLFCLVGSALALAWTTEPKAVRTKPAR